MTGFSRLSELPLDQWADHLEANINPRGVIQRIAVLAQTDSTQHAAARMADAASGLMLVAGRQTAGRARLGRHWADIETNGLAVTFAIDASGFDDGMLSLAAGLAACQTVEDSLAFPLPNPNGSIENSIAWGAAILLALQRPHLVGLRWPNDVVEHPKLGRRKIAGVLIDRRDNLALVGIGINVAHMLRDWPDELIAQAISLNQLGSKWSRLDVAIRLLTRFERVLRLPSQNIAKAWRRRNTLSRGKHTFEYDGRRFTGTVLTIVPTSEIVISTRDGIVTLPALGTSLLRDELR